ncbi:MAG: flagellar filament capping protein FliD, partial [Oscillospiraceae bacterium]|nr:flagellar filament capping protein FliD [Oscillospiraceae bacterium]
GSVTKTVSFEVSAEETDGKIDMDQFKADTVDALNKSLQEDFGYSGKSGAGVQGAVDADGKEWFIQGKLNADGKIEFDVGGNAIASITEKTGNFGLAQPASKVAIAAQSAVTGENTIAIEVDGVTKSVSFNGFASTFFDSKDEAGNESILTLYNNLKLEAYRKENNLTSADKVSQEELDKFAYTSTQAAKDYNSNQIVLKANAAFRSEGITFNIDKSYMTATKDGENVDLAVTATSGGTLSLTKGRASNKYSGSTRLSEMGITGNGEEGEFTFKINGKEISVDREGTINDLITAVKKSGAGVTLTFSNLSNKFEITANDLGNGGTINIEGNDITKALGLTDDNGDTIGFTAGQNAIININGQEIYHNSNDFTVDGTTFSFDETVTLGEVYNVGIEKSYDDVKQTIKDFVNDYNQLIDDVYNHIGTARKKDSNDNYYEPLTDEEKEAMTTEQIEKWEEAAKAGVIYNDSTISSVMSQIRTALYNSVTLDDGTRFGLFSMGIKTSSDYTAHGKLEIDEDAFDAAFENNPEAIEKLFTDSENGIMQKVNTVFDNAVRTNSQNPGSLVRKAGLATGLTATKNTMYNEMQTITNRIKQLQEKYTAKEEYWWKVFTNLESAMSDLNSQSNYLASYLGTGSN